MNEEIKIPAKERVEGIFNPATENNDRGKPGKYSTHLQEIKDIRTATITQKGQICIPSVARNLAGFKEGTKISVVVFEDRVELRPLKKENSFSAKNKIRQDFSLGSNNCIYHNLY